MNNYDFVVRIGEQAPEVEPVNLLKSIEANNALHHAYQWASARAEQSITAANAKVYIEAIEQNREFEPMNPDRADYVQLLYIMGNLSSWRGEHAKESRQALKEYMATIKNS